MSPQRARIIDDMILAGLAEETRKLYVQAVRRLAAHYPSPKGCEPSRGDRRVAPAPAQQRPPCGCEPCRCARLSPPPRLQVMLRGRAPDPAASSQPAGSRRCVPHRHGGNASSHPHSRPIEAFPSSPHGRSRTTLPRSARPSAPPVIGSSSRHPIDDTPGAGDYTKPMVPALPG
jgi:hypothetical protein